MRVKLDNVILKIEGGATIDKNNKQLGEYNGMRDGAFISLTFTDKRNAG